MNVYDWVADQARLIRLKDQSSDEETLFLALSELDSPWGDLRKGHEILKQLALKGYAAACIWAGEYLNTSDNVEHYLDLLQKSVGNVAANYELAQWYCYENDFERARNYLSSIDEGCMFPNMQLLRWKVTGFFPSDAKEWLSRNVEIIDESDLKFDTIEDYLLAEWAETVEGSKVSVLLKEHMLSQIY